MESPSAVAVIRQQAAIMGERIIFKDGGHAMFGSEIYDPLPVQVGQDIR
jgi:hypothetical protein